MTDREIFLLVCGTLKAAGREVPELFVEARDLLGAADLYLASPGPIYQVTGAKTQRFSAEKPNESNVFRPGTALDPDAFVPKLVAEAAQQRAHEQASPLAVESPPKPAPATPLTPDSNLVNPVILDGWGVPVKATAPEPYLSAPPPDYPTVHITPVPSTKFEDLSKEHQQHILALQAKEKQPIAPWADPKCQACSGSGYNTKGVACPICKAKQIPDKVTVKATRGKTGKQIIVDVPSQTMLDLSGGGSNSPAVPIQPNPAQPVAAPAGQSFSTDYMTCDQCPSDKLIVNLLPGDQGEAVYTCQTCGHTEGFNLEPDDLIELKGRGIRLPPAVRPTGPDGEEIFHRSDVAGLVRPAKGRKGKKAQAVAQSPIPTTTAQSPNGNLLLKNGSISQPSLSTSSEPSNELPEFTTSTPPKEPEPQPSPKIKTLVDDLLSPCPNPSLGVNEILAKAELELVVAGWDKAKLISKWEDLTKKSYSEGMALGKMADQVVAGMMGVRV